jgi:hypothetical protein
VSFTVSTTPLYGISLDVPEGGLVFPARGLGYAVEPLTVTVTNTGNESTGVLAVALDGDDADSFTVSPGTVGSIESGGTGTFTVRPNTGLGVTIYETVVTVDGTAHESLAKSFNVGFRVIPERTEIATAVELAKIGGEYPLTGTYMLVNDLELDEWVPIGNEETPFTGTLLGNGKTVTVNSFASAYMRGDRTRKYIGILGYVTDGTVEDLAVHLNMPEEQKMWAQEGDNSGYAANQYVGAVAGYALTTEFTGITLSGSIRLNKTDATSLYLGGLCGYMDTGTVRDVDSSLELDGQATRPSSGDASVGGFFGAGYGITVMDSSISGKVSGYSNWNEASVGGVLGCIYRASLIGEEKPKAEFHFLRIAASAAGEGSICKGNEQTYAVYTNSVTTGGLAGSFYDGDIKECYSTGPVTCKSYAQHGAQRVYAGGIVGHFGRAEITDCYSSGNIISEGKQGGNGGVTVAGGIVGYLYGGPTTIRRSYAAGMLTAICRDSASTRPHAGGIVGHLMGSSVEEENNRIENCAGLVTKITWKEFATDEIILRRIANFGKKTGSSSPGRDVDEHYPETNFLVNNIGNKDIVIDYQPNTAQMAKMPEVTLSKGPNAKDGADCAAKPVQSVFTGLDWDFSTVWKMGADGYPVLQWQVFD